MDQTLFEQADEIAVLLPAVMRCLFRLEDGHPVAEMPLAQVRLLGVLEGGPRAMSVVSDELGISVSAVTQVADRMARAGLVERVTEPEDRRVRHLRLTPTGEEVLHTRRLTRVRAVARALEGIGAGQRQSVVQALRVLLDAGSGLPGASEDRNSRSHADVQV